MAPHIGHEDRSTVNGNGNSPRPSTKTNGHTYGTSSGGKRTSGLRSGSSDDIADLLCIGFGPASLAIAIALHDRIEEAESKGKIESPNVTFLEKQPQFAWHAGMLLPGSKMQISFVKDLATLRNPRSQFTFLNYLHHHDRLVQFANLGTFLPSRIEFEDYMRWCSEHFQDCVEYGQEVLDILPRQESSQTQSPSEKIGFFTVKSQNLSTGQLEHRNARNVVIAIGGKPRIPAPFPAQHPRVIHSSQYVKHVTTVLPIREKAYRIAIVGSGQSAAEIFSDLHSRYPNSRTAMIIKDTALRPSDDSPFVNEIFDPQRVDSFYGQPEDHRIHNITSDKSTNYGVVRLELLEHIYNDLYDQRIKSPNENDWQHRILRSREVTGVSSTSYKDPLILRLRGTYEDEKEDLEVDAVFVATGYTRNAHEEILHPLRSLGSPQDLDQSGWRVHRNYKVDLDSTKVEENAGIWLQGCNEITHGLSDTLLSILATRGGEMVSSIFGSEF